MAIIFERPQKQSQLPQMMMQFAQMWQGQAMENKKLALDKAKYADYQSRLNRMEDEQRAKTIAKDVFDSISGMNANSYSQMAISGTLQRTIDGVLKSPEAQKFPQYFEGLKMFGATVGEQTKQFQQTMSKGTNLREILAGASHGKSVEQSREPEAMFKAFGVAPQEMPMTESQRFEKAKELETFKTNEQIRGEQAKQKAEYEYNTAASGLKTRWYRDYMSGDFVGIDVATGNEIYRKKSAPSQTEKTELEEKNAAARERGKQSERPSAEMQPSAINTYTILRDKSKDKIDMIDRAIQKAKDPKFNDMGMSDPVINPQGYLEYGGLLQMTPAELEELKAERQKEYDRYDKKISTVVSTPTKANPERDTFLMNWNTLKPEDKAAMLKRPDILAKIKELGLTELLQ